MARKKGGGRDEKKAARWEGLIREQGESGECVRGFCRRRRLSESRFHWWRRELRSRGLEGFAAVTVTDVGDEEGRGIEVVGRGDRRIRIRPGFDEETLRRVVGCLEAEGC